MQRAARDQAAVADALATVEQFNSRLAAGKVGMGFGRTIALGARQRRTRLHAGRMPDVAPLAPSRKVMISP